MSAREAMQQALEALNLPSMKTQQMLLQRDEAIATLRAALAEEALQRLTGVQQEIEAVLEQQAEPVTCEWSLEDDDTMPGTYSSACGELWSFIDGGWKDNRVNFCHGCGGRVIEAKLKEKSHD